MDRRRIKIAESTLPERRQQPVLVFLSGPWAEWVKDHGPPPSLLLLGVCFFVSFLMIQLVSKLGSSGNGSGEKLLSWPMERAGTRVCVAEQIEPYQNDWLFGRPRSR